MAQIIFLTALGPDHICAAALLDFQFLERIDDVELGGHFFPGSPVKFYRPIACLYFNYRRRTTSFQGGGGHISGIGGTPGTGLWHVFIVQSSTSL